MSWSYSFSKKAQRQFQDLQDDTQLEIVAALDRFLDNPSASDVKKIKTAKPPYWRIRVGKELCSDLVYGQDKKVARPTGIETNQEPERNTL